MIDKNIWNPIAGLTSLDGQVMLKGPSGYLVNECHYETGFMVNGNIYDDAGDLYTDSWPAPTHWRKIIS